MNKDKSFEESIRELEVLVEKLEQGQLPLDESLQLYEQGMLTARQCQDYLDHARLVLEKLGEAEVAASKDS